MNAAHIVSPLLVGLADLLESGQGHALISACPGAGKTHTLTKIAQRHSNYKILALVFNRHNAQELRTRLPQSCEVKTIHSLAVGLLYKGGLRYTPCASVGASCYREMRELLETSLLTRVSPAAYKAMLSELAARYDAYLLSALAFEPEYPKFDSPTSVAASPLVPS